MDEKKLELEIRDFLNRNRVRYNRLLQTVREAALETQRELGSDCVTRIYSRGQKQPGDREFKSTHRIAEKITRERAADPGRRISDLNDIVGLTVVIQYPDQADEVIDFLKKKLARMNIQLAEKYPIHEHGYHADHLQCVSNDVAHANLWCEIQVKTMLHDAWSSKMHDPTYNPSGRTDNRLVAMVEAIGDTMRLAEQQSVVLRKMIKEQWAVESELRERVRSTFLEIPHLRRYMSNNATLAALTRDVAEAAPGLASSDPGHGDIARFAVRVTELSRDDPFTGWLASFVLCSQCRKAELTGLMERCAEDWLEDVIRKTAIQSHPDGAIPVISWEASTLPMCFYALGKLEHAIDFSHRLLDSSLQIQPDSKGTIMFNLGTFYTELEYYRPSKRETRDRRRAVAEGLLAQGRELINPAPSDEIEQNTQGFMQITFSDSQDDILQGIRQCETAPQHADPNDVEIAKLYADFYRRWGGGSS